MVFHYRKLLFAFIVVWMETLAAIELGLIMLLSTMMMILIFSFMPYNTRKQNKIEGFSEAYILVVLYHMLSLTDFVPVHFIQTRKKIGYSCIFVIAIALSYFILSILVDIGIKIY